jgi:ribosomal protein S18 acetylase RimI-like enzyme
MPIVTDILTKSYSNNPTINEFLKKKTPYFRRSFFEYAFLKAYYCGSVFLNSNNNATCLILYPNKFSFRFRLFSKSIFVALFRIGLKNLLFSIKVQRSLIKVHKNINVAHLWFLGTSPDYIKKGEATFLMKEIIEHYKKNKIDLYVESRLKENTGFYKKLGFKQYSNLSVGHITWDCLKIENNKIY